MRFAHRHAPARPPAETEDAAVYWSARRRLGLNDEADEQAFAAWRAAPAHAEAFQAVEAEIEAAGALAEDPEVLRERRQALLSRGQRRWRGLAFLALAGLGLFAVMAWRHSH